MLRISSIGYLNNKEVSRKMESERVEISTTQKEALESKKDLGKQ